MSDGQGNEAKEGRRNGAEGSATAPEDGTLDALARQYLDLWQDQVSALAGDDELAAAMTRLFAAIGPGPMAPAASGALQPWLMWPGFAAAAWPGLQGGGTSDRGERREQAEDGGDRVGPAGTEAAAAASDRRDGDLAELARRLAALEQRIAVLEGAGDAAPGSARRVRKPAGGARKRRP